MNPEEYRKITYKEAIEYASTFGKNHSFSHLEHLEIEEFALQHALYEMIGSAVIVGHIKDIIFPILLAGHKWEFMEYYENDNLLVISFKDYFLVNLDLKITINYK